MFGKTLDVTQPTSNPSPGALLLWPSSSHLHSTPSANLPVASSEGKIFVSNGLVTGAKHFFRIVYDDVGAVWRQDPISGIGLRLKRSMDILVSSVALVFLWPLMLLIALAVKLESLGPAIYSSARAGKGGHKFACYKFRTMVTGSDRLREQLRGLNQRCGPFFKIADDPRVTRFGKFLRKYSLDELPQFWNVLKGDMSLVGPRPHPIEDYAQYSVEHCLRLKVKPGLTGLWQVLARRDPSFEICMMLDLGYIKKWSLLLDLRILTKTIPAVLAGEGQ